MNVGYIPLAEMEVYCRLFDIVDTEMFVLVMVKLDSIFLEFINRDKKDG